LAPQPSIRLRIATRLLLAMALLVMGVATVAGKNPAGSGHSAPPLSAALTAIDAPSQADDNAAPCLMAPPTPLIHEPGLAASETEPGTSLGGYRIRAAGLAPCQPRPFHGPVRAARRTASLGRGPPRQA
jgi:hypothetical protein